MIGKTTLWRHPGHLVWILAAYVPLLGRMMVPFTGDQKTYIAIAMEMRERGEWLQPLLFGEPNYLKPPFQYWMTLLSWKVFGFNVFATFLPGVLALVGTAWLLNEIASLLGERRWYVNSGLWFAATLGGMTYALSAQMDIYVCLFYAGAWWAGLKFLAEPEDDERRVAWLYAAFAIAGLSSLLKSPLYAAFWVVGYLIYILTSGEWLLLKNRHLYFAWLGGIAIGLLWFIALFVRDGNTFWDQYILHEQFQKGANGGTLGDLWIPLLHMTFPFTLLLFTALRSAWMGRRTAGILRFALAWSIPPALFFSVFPYRTGLYLFILVPALSILVDWSCFRANRTRTFTWLARATGFAMAFGLAAAGFALYRFELVPAWLFLAFVFTGVAAAFVLWFGYVRVFTITALAAVLFFRIASTEVAKIDHGPLVDLVGEPAPYTAAMLDENRDIWHEIGMLSISLGSPMRRLFGYDDVVEHLQRNGVLILSDEQTDKYRITLDHAFAEKGEHLDWRTWKRFKRRSRLPIREILLAGRGSVPETSFTREFSIVRLAGTDAR
ncbi:MAG: glycosyltransferase family 39 protein [Bdellovibrionales bacterium]|nr:glycosyltransferase family 39 protein [Bdellovibrionales bacterium]